MNNDSRPRGTVFFDYDGTLHNTMHLYGPAFRTAYAWLVSEGLAQPREFDDRWIAKWLGWQTRDMWTTFMPSLEEPQWRHASDIVAQEMERLMEEGHARLFEGAAESLDALKADGFDLVFLSNCRHRYSVAHRENFGLDRWFSAFLCSEDYPGMLKWQIYQEECANHPLPHVMVGDRFHDLEVATRAGIPSIGCAYGFGDPEELADATVIIDDASQIHRTVRGLLS